jgi:hypothetical protein
MKNLIFILFTLICLFSCGSSEVSSRRAVVTSIEFNHEGRNKEVYKVVARYIDEKVYVMSLSDGRVSTSQFTIYTDKCLSIGDTIQLLYE